MNDTIKYYNNNAESYFQTTVDANLADPYDRFLEHVPEHGSIIDIGCGSGRDVVAFASRGYRAMGLDASEQLVEAAKRYTGAPIVLGDMTTWIAEEPFDGIWCCASLLHLDDEGVESFFRNLEHNLNKDGAIYVSVKSGIETGFDEKGRYMRNFTGDELRGLFDVAGITVVDCWDTGDQLNRTGFWWINMIGIKSN